jgi:hypothetical protein
MKKIITLIICVATCGTFSQAQWKSEASGFTTPERGLCEMIAVSKNAAWGMAYDKFNPFGAPITEFTRTVDGGNHWTPGTITTLPTDYLIGIAPVTENLCYAITVDAAIQYSKILKTTDGGLTWTVQLSYLYQNGFFGDIYFFNATDGIVYGDPNYGYAVILTTHDGGKHWVRVPATNMPRKMHGEGSYILSGTSVGNSFWVVSSNGRVWKTTDKGLHWVANSTEVTKIDFSNIKMRDVQHGLWGVKDELYKTSDGGITWTEIFPKGKWFTADLAYVPGTASTWVSTGSRHDVSGYGALHGTGSSYSTDDGKTWITIDSGVNHLALDMVSTTVGFTGGFNLDTTHRGVFKYCGPPIGCDQKITNVVTSDLSTTNKNIPVATVYPNPISTSATISFSLTQSQKVSIQIFDETGKLIKTLADEQIQAGTHQLVWNAKDKKGNRVIAGIYFLRMQTGNYTGMKKLVVVR